MTISKKKEKEKEKENVCDRQSSVTERHIALYLLSP